MILAFDTSSAACTVALFDGDGTCLAHRDELIGRGHSERLVPMIAELLDGRSADRDPGRRRTRELHRDSRRNRSCAWARDRLGRRALRNVIACAACSGRGCGRRGRSSNHRRPRRTLRAAIRSLPRSDVRASQPRSTEAARFATAPLVVGSGAAQLVEARGSGEAREAWPRASEALQLPGQFRTLPPKPVYARAPDARVREAA